MSQFYWKRWCVLDGIAGFVPARFAIAISSAQVVFCFDNAMSDFHSLRTTLYLTNTTITPASSLKIITFPLDTHFLAIMTVKRRNHGRNKHGRGHTKRVRCVTTGKAIPKDKAIKRFIVRNIVDASSLRDIKDASAYQEYQLPKLYIKMYYCVEAAVHQRIVRLRSREDRRIRAPPPRFVARK